MSDDRLRIPQDPDYFRAFGLAAIAFSRLEWDAVWCCERLQSGYINKIERGKKTAGAIAEDLKKLFSRVSDPDFRLRILPYAIIFAEVTTCRNGLLHGKPGTSPNGDQRLFRHGVEWTIQAVNEFSDQCVRAGVPLNALLYKELSHGCAVALNPP